MYAEVLLTRSTRAQVLARHVAVAVAGASLVTVLALGAAPVTAHAEEDNQQGAVAQVVAAPSSVTVASEPQQTTSVTSQDSSHSTASASTNQTTTTSTSTSDRAADSSDTAADVTSSDGGVSASSGSASTGAQGDTEKDSASSAAKSAATATASTATSMDATVPGEDKLPEGTYAIVSGNGSHKALDVSGASKSNGANVQIYDENGTDAQHWQLTYNRDKTSKYYGMARLVNVNSGKALDVYSAIAKSGTNVQQYTANDSTAQWWQLVQDAKATGRSGYLLRSALLGDFVLDVNGGGLANGTNVQIWASNGSAAQRFTFVALEDEKSDPWLASGVAKLAREHA